LTSYNDDLDIDVQGENAQGVKLLLATIDDCNSSTGSTLIFDGTDTPSTKRYKRVGSATFSPGNRVLVAKISGTYLVLGRIY